MAAQSAMAARVSLGSGWSEHHPGGLAVAVDPHDDSRGELVGFAGALGTRNRGVPKSTHQ